MSYLIKKSSKLIKVKLTEVGRKKLSAGKLEFTYWAAGDSEIDYQYASYLNSNMDEMILRPKDDNPNIKSFLKTSGDEIFILLTNASLKVQAVTLNNVAVARGFFNSSQNNTFPATGNASRYITQSSPVTLGGTIILTDATIAGGISAISTGQCNFILVRFRTDGTAPTDIAGTIVNEPTITLFFKVVSKSGSDITLDRPLPTASGAQVILYPGCDDPINTYYGSACTTSNWSTSSLSFDTYNCSPPNSVPVWNQNNVWCETMAGTPIGYKTHEYYGSVKYIGEKEYLGYPCDCDDDISGQDLCDVLNSSYIDNFIKGIGIIHYTNNMVSNAYGEFFYIDADDDKVTNILMPTIMWHNRYFSGATGNTNFGMRFISDGKVRYVKNSDIKYHNLIEDPDLIFSGDTPLVVGRVFPQLKIVTIHDEELLATTVFKSNRNWSLPRLAAELITPTTTDGALKPNETMYLTYALGRASTVTTGLSDSLHCQKYVKITNTTNTDKDVGFRIESTGKLKYMRSTTGLGFNATALKLIYQVVSGQDIRPLPYAWKTQSWVAGGGALLNPSTIENQNPAVNNYILTYLISSGASIYDISTTLGVTTTATTTGSTFGEERFFYGNLDTYIGARVYKTLFDINVGGSYFINSSNPTFSKAITGVTRPELTISEIGIYDSKKDLVMIGKMSIPVTLSPTQVANIEMTMDF